MARWLSFFKGLMLVFTLGHLTGMAYSAEGLGKRLLIGYWHNFDNGSGFIRLKDVSPAWDIVNVSFAEPAGPSQAIVFTPYGYASADDFKEDVKELQSRGQKVVISVGGANGQVSLKTSDHRQNFVQSMIQIISTWQFDGMDIDFEGHSLYLEAGDTDLQHPRTPVITELITAIRSIRNHFGSKFILTMAPETFFVQVGYAHYGGLGIADPRAGAYLPVIHAVRDILTVLQVQHYNSGPVMGLDGQYHFMGGADFHIAMAEMVLLGFPIAGNPQNFFPGLREDQVAFGLPASVHAGNGYTSEAAVHEALSCLVKGKAGGCPHRLQAPEGYPGLRGLMSWSINWDAFGGFTFSRAHRAYLDSLSDTRAAPSLIWRQANMTHFTSYPDPGSEECIKYNGCKWAGMFAALPGKQPESWVKANNIAAVHAKDFPGLKLKTLRLRKDSRQIDVKVYDMCSDSDCNGCCTQNSQSTGFLIDLESYTAERFGKSDGIVEWTCLDC
ncbi:chitinase [Oligoflexus tunisiensis]|uniref:chitinase n=1 Tax=Oligoflexus tunisiensis TaxID=708132 RepID=UPI000AF04D84|nr:chitinase [Oligoflexus tunisiensis]